MGNPSTGLEGVAWRSQTNDGETALATVGEGAAVVSQIHQVLAARRKRGTGPKIHNTARTLPIL